MYAFIDKDKRQVNIQPEEAESALKLADDFRKLNFPNDEHAKFHQTKRMYWEDFYTQLNKLINL